MNYISDSTIYASSDSSNKQAWLSIQYGAQNDKITVDQATKIIDSNDADQTDNTTYCPFVGWNGTKYKYLKSYDLHSVLAIGSNSEALCYHGASDAEALVSGGTHIPFKGCTGE